MESDDESKVVKKMTDKPPELSHGEVARRVLKQFHIRFHKGKVYEFKDNGNNGKIVGYVAVSDRQLEADIHRSYNEWRVQVKGKDVSTGFIKEVVRYLERELYSESQSDSNYIYLNNGMLDILELKVIPVTPDIFAPFRIPITYDSRAKCPNIDAFFLDITTDKKYKKDNKGMMKGSEHDDNDVLTLEEMFGYALEVGTQFNKKGIILLGHRHSGKTTVFNLMTAFLGGGNISRLDLYAFADRFSIPSLVGRLVNIGDDFGKDRLNGQARGLLKQLIGGTKELMVRKIRGNAVSFEPTTKIYFGCNELPSIKMTDDGFIDRWNILIFVNHYPINRNFLNGLTTPEELSGLLNKAIDGLRRLRDNEQFSKSKTQSYDDLYRLFDEAKILDKRRLGPEHIVNVKDLKVVSES